MFLAMLFAAVLSVALHEGAHLFMAWFCGLQIKRLGVNWKGVYLIREAGLPVQNLQVTLAGPLANLAIAALFWSAWPWFGLCNLVLGLSNLLPLPGLDGHRAYAVWQQLRSS